MYVPAETYTFHIWQSEKLDTFGKLDTFQYTWDCVYYDVIPSVPTLKKIPTTPLGTRETKKAKGGNTLHALSMPLML